MLKLSSLALFNSNTREERNCCSMPFISFYFHRTVGRDLQRPSNSTPLPCAGPSFIRSGCSSAADILQVNLIVEKNCKNFSDNIKINVFWHSFQARSSHQDDCRNFLIDFAKSDPAQDFSGQKSELFKGLIQACKKQAPKTDTVAGSTVDQAVNSTFAALVYLTPDLYEKLQKYGNSNIRLS